MNLKDFLSRLGDVRCNRGEYSAHCPAHDDKHSSLSIQEGKDGRILVFCHAGCTMEEIVNSLGLTKSDLFPTQATSHAIAPTPITEVEYFYHSEPPLKKVRRRCADGGKTFSWMHLDSNGQWQNGRKGITPPLYTGSSPQIPSAVYIVEGEKDVLTLEKHGLPAVSLADGAKSKWYPEYSQMLQGKTVYIIPDNDEPGRAYADRIARHLQDAGCSLKNLDLRDKWPDIPAHGDISDFIDAVGSKAALQALADLTAETAEYTRNTETSDASESGNISFLSLFKPLTAFTEKDPVWLVDGWIPKGQITLFAGDGGIGKTSVWVNLLAAFSSGLPTLIDSENSKRNPMRVAFCTTEDSVSTQLKRRLREAGAKVENIIALDPSADTTGELADFKFGRKRMELFLRRIRPEVVVFDPIQAFIPPTVNMGSRNAMRDCLAPLDRLGEDLGITFVLVAHTNKRRNVYGRARISDSSDLWDIARSVIMLGRTPEENIRYLSNEKNNYSPLQETVLFDFDASGLVKRVGTSAMRDQDYMLAGHSGGRTSTLEACADWIRGHLRDAGGEVPNTDLIRNAMAAGFTQKTVRKAKELLHGNTGKPAMIGYRQAGTGKDKTFHTYLIDPAFTGLGSNDDIPFDEDVN